jgi:REP element-mobilizing transposase RayT
MGIEVKRMSEMIHLSHNVSILIYHYVCPAKYRRIVFSADVEKVLKEVCLEMEDRYDFRFLEIGTDKDHVHFLVQCVPRFSPTQIIRTIKSITAKKIFERCPEVKDKLWGGQLWSDGYYVSTVGQHGNEEVISKYVRNQGKEEEYKQLFVQQMTIFG